MVLVSQVQTNPLEPWVTRYRKRILRNMKFLQLHRAAPNFADYAPRTISSVSSKNISAVDSKCKFFRPFLKPISKFIT